MNNLRSILGIMGIDKMKNEDVGRLLDIQECLERYMAERLQGGMVMQNVWHMIGWSRRYIVIWQNGQEEVDCGRYG